MIFHTVYTMTLGQLSEMYETKNIKIIKRTRFWIPSGVIKKVHKQFNDSLSKMFNQKAFDKWAELGKQTLFIMNKITMLNSLYQGLAITPFPEMLEYYKKTYKKDYKELSDLKPIATEIKRLHSRLKGMSIEQPVEAKQPSFETMVTAVEQIQGIPMDYNMKVYQFKHKYDKALLKAKEYEKQRKNG
jgi:hypothetical protein